MHEGGDVSGVFHWETQRNIGEEMATFSDLLLRGHQYLTTPQVWRWTEDCDRLGLLVIFLVCYCLDSLHKQSLWAFKMWQIVFLLRKMVKKKTGVGLQVGFVLAIFYFQEVISLHTLFLSSLFGRAKHLWGGNWYGLSERHISGGTILSA